MNKNIRNHFPILKNKDIAYLDSAATTQKPNLVIEDIKEYYENFNANAGRGTHELAMISKSIIENTREKIKEFVNCKETGEVVFTKNCTEAINLVAYSYGLNFLKKGDEIILGISNHHSNIVPWQYIARKKGVKIKYIYLDKNGQLDLNDYKYKLNENTKLVAISSVVNTTGIIQNYKQIIELAHKKNVLVLLDVAQAIVHFEQNFDKWNPDFMVFSGHKMFSSFGVGVLVAKKELLEKMPPFILGGDMIEYVEEQKSTYAKVPTKFEGGTLNSAAISSLSRAIDYIRTITYKEIENVENLLMMELMFKLTKLNFVEIYYTENIDRVAVISFNVKGVHSHDTAFILDQHNVAVRSGHHCTAPLLKYMGVNSTCRISLGIYNNSDDIDKLIYGLKQVKEVFKL
ncbi:SufS family cysteine desulfurase [Oceanivirga salmonicida]|uniref:SufS family cysteine desulfurase n=1 Tax=Oceanivirga salmonicida TaxID=1769291 RepID=UPI00082EF5C6|nr:SufS family cysteine desulfurase [Oceanivirga salmonicida]